MYYCIRLRTLRALSAQPMRTKFSSQVQSSVWFVILGRLVRLVRKKKVPSGVTFAQGPEGTSHATVSVQPQEPAADIVSGKAIMEYTTSRPPCDDQSHLSDSNRGLRLYESCFPASRRLPNSSPVAEPESFSPHIPTYPTLTHIGLRGAIRGEGETDSDGPVSRGSARSLPRPRTTPADDVQAPPGARRAGGDPGGLDAALQIGLALPGYPPGYPLAWWTCGPSTDRFASSRSESGRGIVPWLARPPPQLDYACPDPVEYPP